jgi:predicted acetyltransferase
MGSLLIGPMGGGVGGWLPGGGGGGIDMAGTVDRAGNPSDGWGHCVPGSSAMAIDDTIEVRAPEPHEWRAATDTFRAALLSPPSSDEDWAKGDDSWHACASLTAWDGTRCVGHAGAYPFETVVPGGARLPTAGITRVGVLPTHTRRGLLSTMMHRLLREARHERGQTLASLRASEAVIYGRFGFGVAGHACEVEIERRRAGFHRGLGAGGSMRLLARDEILDIVPELYDRVAGWRPGVIARPAWMWRRYLEGALPDGKEARDVAVHLAGTGDPDGYVDYELSWEERFGELSHSTAVIHDLWGATPEVEATLWRHVLDLDLVDHVRASERPIDDVVRWWLRDARALRTAFVWDEQWLRILDVEAALAARTFGAGRPVVIEVRDDLFDDNDGVWTVDEDGAASTPSAAPDLRCGIAELSAAYLGGTSWWELAAGGRIEAGSPGVVAAADALFAHRPAPFCGSFF